MFEIIIAFLVVCVNVGFGFNGYYGDSIDRLTYGNGNTYGYYDCSRVYCDPVTCGYYEEIYVPKGQCCGVCIRKKRNIDPCYNKKCDFVCQFDEQLVKFNGNCCPVCLPIDKKGNFRFTRGRRVERIDETPQGNILTPNEAVQRYNIPDTETIVDRYNILTGEEAVDRYNVPTLDIIVDRYNVLTPDEAGDRYNVLPTDVAVDRYNLPSRQEAKERYNRKNVFGRF